MGLCSGGGCVALAVVVLGVLCYWVMVVFGQCVAHWWLCAVMGYVVQQGALCCAAGCVLLSPFQHLGVWCSGAFCFGEGMFLGTMCLVLHSVDGCVLMGTVLCLPALWC